MSSSSYPLFLIYGEFKLISTALPIFGGCWVGWKYIKGTKFVTLAEMDFETGRRELDEMEERDAETFKPETRFQKIMSILF